MKITALETIRIAERPNLIWVQVETDEGITGLGETFFGAETVEAHIHEYVAPRGLYQVSVCIVPQSEAVRPKSHIQTTLDHVLLRRSSAELLQKA